MNKTRVSLYFLGPVVGVSCNALWTSGNVMLSLALGVTAFVVGTLFFWEAHSKDLITKW